MEQVTQLLRELADKLGTTVEHLWKVLLQQAEVEKQLCHIWMNVGLYGFGGLAVVLLIVCVIGLFRDWDKEGLAYFFLFICVMGLIGGLTYYSNYSDLLTLTMNPEYWALDKIISRLK